MSTEERCLICGEIIPEGRQVCPLCEVESRSDPREAHQRIAGASEKIITRNYHPNTKTPLCAVQSVRGNNHGKEQHKAAFYIFPAYLKGGEEQ